MIPRGSRLITDSAVTDLPQPDSPTRQCVSPRATANDAPRTASVCPNETRRLVTLRTGVGTTGAGGAGMKEGFGTGSAEVPPATGTRPNSNSRRGKTTPAGKLPPSATTDNPTRSRGIDGRQVIRNITLSSVRPP